MLRLDSNAVPAVRGNIRKISEVRFRAPPKTDRIFLHVGRLFETDHFHSPLQGSVVERSPWRISEFLAEESITESEKY